MLHMQHTYTCITNITHTYVHTYVCTCYITGKMGQTLHADMTIIDIYLHVCIGTHTDAFLWGLQVPQIQSLLITLLP